MRLDCCYCSITKSCPTLCNPMDCSMPGSSVLHYLQEFAQIHVHCVHDAIQPSHPLSLLSPLAFNLSPQIRLSNGIWRMKNVCEESETQEVMKQWSQRARNEETYLWEDPQITHQPHPHQKKKKAIQIFGTCNQYLIWEKSICSQN